LLEQRLSKAKLKTDRAPHLWVNVDFGRSAFPTYSRDGTLVPVAEPFFERKANRERPVPFIIGKTYKIEKGTGP
jgi:hypothetical protein